MLPEGKCQGKGCSLRFKFTCPKTVIIQGLRICSCEEPCTDSPSGRMHYISPDKDFRMYPGVIRGSEEWVEKYYQRTCIERTLSSLKANECVVYPKTLNLASIRSDVYLATCTKLITVILAKAIKKPNYLRSLNNIMKLAS